MKKPPKATNPIPQKERAARKCLSKAALREQAYHTLFLGLWQEEVSACQGRQRYKQQPSSQQAAPSSTTGVNRWSGAFLDAATLGLLARINALASLPSPASQPAGRVAGSRPASAAV
jgi:hypothetical protein